jgi:hypothetical protein
MTWKMLLALVVIAIVAATGSILGHFLGPPKTFFLTVAVMVIWSIAGWFLGGWRHVLAGLAALTAAITASDSNYPLALIFSCIAFLSLFVEVTPREADEHPKGFGHVP